MTTIDLNRTLPRRRFALSWNGAALALLALLVLLVICTFHDYGVTWDEDVHNWYGVFVLDYYLSAFVDTRALHWQDLINYGAAFDMTAALINRISPFGTYETRHLLNALTGILGLVGAWKAGRFLAGPRAGLFAAVLLATIRTGTARCTTTRRTFPSRSAISGRSIISAASSRCCRSRRPRCAEAGHRSRHVARRARRAGCC